MTTVTHPTQEIQNATIADDMASLVQVGTAALEEGDLMAALSAFEKVIAAYPERPEGYNNLGAMYSALGESEKAEKCFDQVLQILPQNPDVHYNRGVSRSRQEKFDSARDDFIVVLKANPNDSDTLNNLGVMDFMQGKLPSARKYFKKAIKKNPAYTNALLNLIDVEQTDGNSAKAVALCEDYLKSNSSIEVRRKLFDLLSNGCREAIDKASQVAETLIGTDADNNDTRQQLGRLIQARSALTAEAG
ncbi:MAG: tetratricopeptide repeat protein [bacterium]|nr:tetratricopeptide repeat protein [bacterium]